jgi:hypothetical protein
MDALETALAERLATVNADAEVPPDLAGRVVGAVRRKRRRRLAVAGAALAAVLVAVPVTMAVRQPARTPLGDLSTEWPGPRNPVSGLAMPIAPAAPPGLDALVDRTDSRSVPVAQDGVPFRVDALSLSGLLVGGAGFEVEPYLTADRVGFVDAEEAAVRWMPATSPGFGRAAGTGVVAWSDVGDSLETVWCARARDDWKPVTLGTGLGGGRPAIVASGVLVAWSDDANRVWVSEDCGKPRQVGEGEVLAVTWPDIFVADDMNRIFRVDFETGHRRVEKVMSHGTPAISASGTALAWVDYETWEFVVVYDGEQRVLDRDVPIPDGPFDVTVGRRLAVYSQIRQKGPDQARSVVVDLVTGARVELRSEAFAAGDYLAWREGDHYTVATVR